MKRRPPLLACTLHCVLTAAGAGCTNRQPSSGSCNPGHLSDGSVICIDYPAVADTAPWRRTCETVMRGTWSSGPCAAEHALGGCSSASGTTVWLYRSQQHRTPKEAAGACPADTTAVSGPQ